jgi:DHA1 family putative efflux transporter-like MFS transporter
MNNNWKIYMLSIISFLMGTTQFVIVGMLDKIAASFSVTVSTAGQLSTVFSLAYAIGTPIVMIMTARMDRRKQLLLGLATLLLGIVSTLASPSFAFLIVSRIIIGVGAGVITVTAYATAAQLASSGRQAAAVSNVTLGFSAALVFGVPIGRVIAAAHDWSTIFWGIGILNLLSIFAVARIIPAIEGAAPVPIQKQLALLKKPKIAVAFSLTLLMFFSYSVVYTANSGESFHHSDEWFPRSELKNTCRP